MDLQPDHHFPVAGGALDQLGAGRLMPLSSEQRGYDPLPFGFERVLRDRLAGLPVPVAGIAEIALDAVQIGMDPGGVRVSSSWTILCAWSQLPFAGPPQRGQRRVEPGAGAAARKAGS